MGKNRKTAGIPDYGATVWIAALVLLAMTVLASVPDGYALFIDKSNILSSYLKGGGQIITITGGASYSQVTAYLYDSSGVLKDSGTFQVTKDGAFRGSFRLDTTYRADTYQIHVDAGRGTQFVSFMIYDPPILPRESTDPCPPGICKGGPLFRIDDIDKLTIGFRTVTLALVEAPDKGEPGYAEALQIATNLCIPGSTVSFNIDDKQWQPGQDKEVIAEVFCNRQSLNQKLVESGVGILLTEFCDKSEFSTRQWAQGCEGSPIIGQKPTSESDSTPTSESDSTPTSLIDRIFGGDEKTKEEDRSSEAKPIDVVKLITENLIAIAVVVVMITAGGVYVTKFKKTTSSGDKPTPIGFYGCPGCNENNFVENSDGSVDCEKCGHIPR